MRLRGIAAISDGIYGGGFGLVLGGSALGVYSRVAAETRDLSSRYGDSGLAGVPERVGGAAIVFGALLALALALVAVSHRFRQDPPGWRTDPVTGLATKRSRDPRSWRRDPVIGWAPTVLLVVGVALFLGDGWWGKFVEIRSDHPYFPRMPTAMAAYALVMAGLACIAIGSLAADHAVERSAGWWRRVVAAALVLTVAVAAVAIAAGEDRWNVDRTTAEHRAPQPVPQEFGAEAYRVPIPVDDTYELSLGVRTIDVVAAGPGFVVGGRAGLTAYDGSTGAERWHHRRTEQSGTLLGYRGGTMKAVDDGVLVAAWSRLGWQGFDATTGEVLWTDSDFERDYTSVDWAWDLLGGTSLVLANPTQLAGYDARTGNRRWLVDTDDPTCLVAERNAWSRTLQDVGVGTVVYRAGMCVDNGASWWRVTAIDSLTGTIIASHDIAHNPTVEDRPAEGNDLTMRRFRDTIALTWRNHATSDYQAIFITDPADLTTPVTHTDHTYPRDISPSGDLLVGEYTTSPNGDRTHDTYLLDPSTGLPRYHLGDSRYTPADPEYRAFLDHEIVELHKWSDRQTRERQLRVWNSHDGTMIRESSITDCGDTDDPVQVLPVPGAVLVVCRTGEPTDRRGKPFAIVGVN